MAASLDALAAISVIVPPITAPRTPPITAPRQRLFLSISAPAMAPPAAPMPAPS